MKAILKNIGLLATPTGSRAKGGTAQGDITLLPEAWLLFDETGILDLGTGLRNMPGADRSFNAKGGLVTPGLVDSHTHLVFGGWREKELAQKLAGASYLEILAQGGGIHSTVEATRTATKEELKAKAKKLILAMLKQGVTTLEAKSGYGLDTATELKMLEVVQELKGTTPVSLVATFMGAHALPKEYGARRRDYIDLVIKEMLPQVTTRKLAEFIDVFCEEGVFTVEESREILEAGKNCGLGLKCHSDEIVALGGTEMAAQLGAVSCEHLIKVEPEGIKALAQNATIACLLPGTSFYLNSTYAPARKLIEAGVPIAFGSDFNPGSNPCNSLQLAMHIGCYRYGMSPAECLTAVTLNGAAALGRAERCGTLEPGKAADFVLWEAPNLEYLFYRYGDNFVRRVFKAGKAVIGNY